MVLRYRIQVTPLQQASLDFQKLVVGAIFGFVFGIGANLIVYYVLNRDRRLRLLEREGKRHKFWKDFFEAQEALPMSARYSPPELQCAATICQTDLARSYQEILGHAVRANTLARFAGIMAAASVVFVLEVFAGGFLSKLIMIPARVGGDSVGSDANKLCISARDRHPSLLVCLYTYAGKG
jgi:hypothetical protein